MSEEVPPPIPNSLALPKVDLEKLDEDEIWWRDHQVWLAERGYMLRARYRPGWEPSWKAHPEKFRSDFEDWPILLNPATLDAVRQSDQNLVMLKKVKKEFHPHEVELAEYLSSENLRLDPRNRCVPILETIPVPDDPSITLLVMPLYRACTEPAWETVGEVVSFVQQVLDGLQYMHELHVAHRDCKEGNIMYDPRPMYPQMFHPCNPKKTLDFKGRAKHSTRTACPVKYYFIDFGLSRRYNPEDGPPREHPILGGDKSVPEFKNWNGELLDPFPTDIYYVGNMIRMQVLQPFRGAEFMKPLVEDMVQDDPSKRPKIQEVVSRFDELLKPIGWRKLRSRLVPADEDAVTAMFANIFHAFRTARYILTRKPAIPIPP